MLAAGDFGDWHAAVGEIHRNESAECAMIGVRFKDLPAKRSMRVLTNINPVSCL